MARCGKCGETKRSAFYPSALRPGRRGVWCKRCSRDYYRQRVAEDREYFLKYQRLRVRSTKAKLREEKREKGCAICGENDPLCLDFHHLDPKSKRYTISLAVSRQKKNIDQLREELRGCVVLCANCHRKTHHRYRVPPKPSKGNAP